MRRSRHLATTRLALLSLALFPAAAHAQVWAQGSERIVSSTPMSGRFGSVVAAIDLDGNGTDELAVADLDGPGTETSVSVLFRTPAGWELGAYVALTGHVELGFSMATGDFDEDGREDLLMGAPGAGGGGGAVYLLRHVDGVLVVEAPIAHATSAGGRCGTALTVGDFDDDTHLDFAAGCPLASFSGYTSAGRVEVAYGAGDGSFSLAALSQATASVGGNPETGDLFGQAVAAGDFNSDGFEDLGIGVPGEDVDGGTDTGAVHVLRGSAAGLTGVGSQLWHQGTAGVPGVSGNGDAFGIALAAGDFDWHGPDSYDDLAIGISEDAENPGGAVLVLYGTGNGPTSAGAQLLTVADLAPPSAPQPGQHLGSGLLVGRIDGDASFDLVIFAAGETDPDPDLAGTVCVLYGSPWDGLLTETSTCFSSASGELASGGGIAFGAGLAIGQLGPAAGRELAIGAPDSREVFVLRNALFADGFELGLASRWSAGP